MCKGRASFVVDRDGVEGACGGREVLLVSLLMRPRSDRSRSCERVTGMDSDGLMETQGRGDLEMRREEQIEQR